MAADDRAPSLLDPIREQGVVKGGLSLATNMLPGVAAGRAAAANDTDGFGISDLFGSLGDFAHEAAYYMPGLGEVMGARTGADILGSDTDLLTKALGATGILGGAIGGVHMAGVLGMPHMALGATNRRAFSGVQGMGVPVAYSRPDILARLSGRITEPIQYDSILPTITGARRDLMRASSGLQSTRFDKRAKIRNMALALTGRRAKNSDQVEGFLETLGDSLVAHVEDYRQSINAQGMDADKAAVAAAGTEASKFDWAVERGVLTVGDDMADVGAIWKRLRSGELLSDVERGALNDALIAFADGTQGASHPEMAFQDPRAWISNIHLDGSESRMGITHMEFDGVPLAELLPDDVMRRITQMANGNPAQLVPLVAANFTHFYNQQVRPNWAKYKNAVPRWAADGTAPPASEWAAHWYKTARLDGEAMAKHYGLDSDELVGVASLLSAGELWESNLDKAVVALKYIREHPQSGVKRVRAHLKKSGFGSTDPEIRNVFDMLASISPRMWFYTKLTGQKALKQPNFTKAILESKPADLRRHAALNYALMRGEISDAHVANLFGELDLEVPVVIDRHAFSLGLGFSTAPAGSQSDSLYRSIRRGLEIAAAAAGEIDELGRHMTPSEFQALLWVAWREARGVTDQFKPSASGFPSLWHPGSGPSYVIPGGSRILEMATQPMPMDLIPRQGGIGKRQKYRTPEELAGRHEIDMGPRGVSRSKTARMDRHRTVTLSIGPEGAQLVNTDPDPFGNRLFYASSGYGPEGQNMRRRRPMLVEDVDSELDRLAMSTVDADGGRALTAGRRYTSTHINAAAEDGRHIVLSAPTVTRHNSFGHQQHLLTLQLLRDRGVNFSSRIDIPHEGPSAVWRVGGHPDDPTSGVPYWSREDLIRDGYDPASTRIGYHTEPRLNLVLSFDTAHDLQLAWATLHEPRPAKMSSRLGIGSVAESAQGAAGYIRMWGRQFGLKGSRGIRHGVQADPGRGRKIATAHARSKHNRTSEKAVKDSYDQMIHEIDAQYDYIVDIVGITIEVGKAEPYASPAEMMADIRNNKTLKVRPTSLDGGHPYLTNEQNDRLRAVHDFFGHAGMGNSFSRDGEYIAYLKHAQMFSEMARGAMFSETMGQNSWLVFSAKNQKRRAQAKRLGLSYEGEFGPQKATLLPKQWWSDAALKKEIGFTMPDGEGGGLRVDELYGEQVLDIAAYTYGDHEAPAGTVGTFEHHIEDQSGNRIAHMSNDGNAENAHTFRAYVDPDGLHQYFGSSTTERHAALPTRHGFVESGDQVWWDGRAVVENPQVLNDHLKAPETRRNKRASARHLFEVKVGGKTPDRIALWVPPEEARMLPVLAYNRTTTSAGGPARTVVLRRSPGSFAEGKGTITVDVRAPSGVIDPSLRDDVHQFLSTSGWLGNVEFKAI